jgi:hypothetical protein
MIDLELISEASTGHKGLLCGLMNAKGLQVYFTTSSCWNGVY